MTTYFLRTVPEIGADLTGLEQKLEVAVYNTGNYFFEAAVARHIGDYTTLHDLEDLREEDATVVLSMSNFISPSTDLGDVAQLLEDKKVARVVMIGAGAQAEAYGDPVSLSPGTRRFLGLLSERSASIGVRGDYTADVLDKLGIRNVDVIGCPSIFYHADPGFAVHARATPPTGMRAAFHCTPTGFYRDSIARLLAFGASNCESYIAQSESYLLGLTSSDPAHVKTTEFFFHYYNDGSIPQLELRDWFKAHTHWFFSLTDWFEHLKGYDFAFGSRFHGNMAALLMGVPALSMVFDTRTRELCEYLNLPYMHLKDFSPSSTLAQLYEATDFSLFNATFRARYEAYRSFLSKNGLQPALPPARPKHTSLDPVQGRTVRRLTEDLIAAGRCPHEIGREVRARLETARDAATRLRVEDGEFERVAQHGLPSHPIPSTQDVSLP